MCDSECVSSVVATPVQRASFDDYLMLTAYMAITRVTCERRKVGAVLARENRILAVGYNGPPKGQPECPGTMICTHGKGVGCEYTIHAEVNALLHANRDDTQGSTLYITMSPCPPCCKLIIQSGIKRVVYHRRYRTYLNSKAILEAAGVECVEWSSEFIDRNLVLANIDIEISKAEQTHLVQEGGDVDVC